LRESGVETYVDVLIHGAEERTKRDQSGSNKVKRREKRRIKDSAFTRDIGALDAEVT
jgi:hypothetical protein